jgi:hypothetical protein
MKKGAEHFCINLTFCSFILLFSGFILKAVSLLTKQVSTYIFAETLSDLRKARLRKQLFLQVEGPLWLSSVPSVKKKKKKKGLTDLTLRKPKAAQKKGDG